MNQGATLAIFLNNFRNTIEKKRRRLSSKMTRCLSRRNYRRRNRASITYFRNIKHRTKNISMIRGVSSLKSTVQLPFLYQIYNKHPSLLFSHFFGEHAKEIKSFLKIKKKNHLESLKTSRCVNINYYLRKRSF